MRSKVFYSLVVVSLILLSWLGVGCSQGPQTEIALSFTLTDVKGETINLDDYLGKKPILLEFWTTGCFYCVKTIPALNEFYGKYKDKAFIFSINCGESERRISAFAERHGINYPILMDKRNEVASSYFVRGIPAIVVIGKDKKVKYFGHSLEEAEKVIGTFLKL